MANEETNPNVITINFLPSNRAKELIYELVQQSKNVRFSKHARKRMRERGVTDIQVYRCLMSGTFKEEPSRSSNGNWQFTMQTMDSGKFVTVVAALDNDQYGNHVIVISTYT